MIMIDQWSIRSQIELIKRKQNYHANGIAVSELEKLKKKLNYVGWENDFKTAEDECLVATYPRTDLYIVQMKRRQQQADNDRYYFIRSFIVYT